ncbi:hypothetical protein ACQKWADRAFT_293941 [Trichoderma austrokoningii]
MKLPDETNFFTCSFCHTLYMGPPCVLGRSRRLACHACSTAIFDLSICWVCGEVVFQGEGGVSLGWCFWHGGCYGCLLCGSRVVCRGVRVRELFGGRGIEEVGEVPLCWDCVIEMEVSRSNKGRKPVSLAGLSIRANVSDPVDGTVPVYHSRQRRRIASRRHRLSEPC